MPFRLFTLSVCFLFTALTASAQEAQYVSGGVATQAERAESSVYHRIDSRWLMIENSEVQNPLLLGALDRGFLISEGIDLDAMKTLNPRDFYVVDDVANGVFPRMRFDGGDGLSLDTVITVFVPFVMSIQFAKQNSLFEQGTINVAGEIRFTTGANFDDLYVESLEVFDYSQPLERISFENGTALAKYDADFVHAMLEFLPTAFQEYGHIEELRDLLISLQIGDRPETIIESTQP